MGMTNEEAIKILKCCIIDKCEVCPLKAENAYACPESSVAPTFVEVPKDVLIQVLELPKARQWISCKDGLPKEHDSIFADLSYFSKHMWTKESDNVNVYIKFPDGTGRVTEGRLQDGQWWTRISPVLNPVITHWMPLPEPPKEYDDDEA